MSERLSHRERGIVFALIISLLLWQLPFGGLVLYPFKLLATWIHEMSHGVVMLLCGTGFESLDIYRDTSGIAHASRGATTLGRALIASAGYLGASLLGAGLLVLAHRGRGARVAMAGLGAAMAISALIWVQNRFGLVVTWTGAGVLLALALVLSEKWASWALSFIAAQACINAVLDIRVLFRSQLVINGEAVGQSDAHRMAESSFASPTFWAAAWLLWSFIAFYVGLRIAHSQERKALQGTTFAEKTSNQVDAKASDDSNAQQ